MKDKRTFGERCADRVAEFGGSWTFVILFTNFLIAWMLYNYYSKHPFDPYPFIFLNLFMSALAAIQAPIIMMSNNRQSKVDRSRQEKDFRTDIDTNLRVKDIERKLEYLMSKNIDLN